MQLRYYVKAVKHVLGSGGYTIDLQCIRDGAGRLARKITRSRASAARSNNKKLRERNQLVERTIEGVDLETGLITEYVRRD